MSDNQICLNLSRCIPFPKIPIGLYKLLCNYEELFWPLCFNNHDVKKLAKYARISNCFLHKSIFIGPICIQEGGFIETREALAYHFWLIFDNGVSIFVLCWFFILSKRFYKHSLIFLALEVFINIKSFLSQRLELSQRF